MAFHQRKRFRRGCAVGRQHKGAGELQATILAMGTDSILVFSRGLRYQPTMANESLDKLARALADSVPEGIRSVRDDLQKNFKSVLQSGIGKLDLVTREEFEVQEAVLARTREKLQALELRLRELETAKPARKKKAGKKKS